MVIHFESKRDATWIGLMMCKAPFNVFLLETWTIRSSAQDATGLRLGLQTR